MEAVAPIERLEPFLFGSLNKIYYI